MSRLSRRALAVATATLLAAAAPAAADPVIAGPATPDELAVMAVGGANATLAAGRSDQVALHRIATADGAYRGRVLFPSATLTKTNQLATVPLRSHALRRSADGRFLLFNASRGGANLQNRDLVAGTAVRVAADGTYTDQLIGTNYLAGSGQSAIGVVSVDGTRKWLGTNNALKPLATLAESDPAMTQVSAAAASLDGITSVDLVDGSLVVTDATGVSRLPGGLPSALDTTTPPQRFISAPSALDAAFVDTDGVSGADAAYVVRSGRGLTKYVLDGGTWKARGSVAGSYGYVAARAVAGAIEVYLTTANTAKVVKLVDTAQIGGALATTGPADLAYAPARARYAGLAFVPDGGFPVDTTPYPATAPVITPSVTTIDTFLGAPTKPSVTLDVFDPNTSDVTVTATSSAQGSLPNSGIVITGTGTTRTATFTPVNGGTVTITFTARAGDDTATATVTLKTSGLLADPTGHYYSGPVDISAAVDVGDGHFVGISDEVNTPYLFKKGVSALPIASFGYGFPGGEGDFEGATRFGDVVVWSGSHGNNRSGQARTERRFLAFQTISGSGADTELEWRNSYTRLWDQWREWDASNGHGLGANALKFNTAMQNGVIPNAPNGFNVEGLTMAPGSSTTAWFGMRAPTITGADGIERALILPVTNIDKLTSNDVDATFGAPILLDLGGRSIRDIAKNANDQYLIEAGAGDTDASLKDWALFTWDGNPAHAPQHVNVLVSNDYQIGAWEGIVEVPNPLVAGAKALLTADSGDTGLGKTYGQYVTIGQPVTSPGAVSGVTAAGKPGEVTAGWNAGARATRYQVSAKTAVGVHAPGSPKLVTGTSTFFEGLTAGTEYTIDVRAENDAGRSATAPTASATPTQGARAATTTSVAFVDGGTYRTLGESQKLVATVSDPNAHGTVEFFSNGNRVADAYDRVLVGPDTYQMRNTFPVVDGKAVIDISNSRSAGLDQLQAKFTTSNPETFQSSDSGVITAMFDWRPRTPWVEVTSITGDRVAGSRLTITAKLHGYTPAELYSLSFLPAEFNTRLNGAATTTRIVGDTPATASGSIALSADGTATIQTTALAAGDHRISVTVPDYSDSFSASISDGIPVTIAPAGSPAPEVQPVVRPQVAVVLSGPGLQRTGQPVTMTAKLSDPTLSGTVQFENASGTALGTAVPVVDGVATTTLTNTNTLLMVYARFEPTANRTTVASVVSPGVARLRGATALPFAAPIATKTAFALSGSTATVTVSPVGGDALAIRDVKGYVEILDGERVVGFGLTRIGVAKIELPAVGGTLRARYVPSDSTRSLGSEVVRTDVTGGPGASVPATLALSLGAPATFGAFVPGVAKEYTAATTANVVSTAGDAALTVSEPGHLTNGAFSLPQPLRVELTPAAWTAPVSNANVGITFKQAIGATDALRTGAYSKTLTFTLSTTTP